MSFPLPSILLVEDSEDHVFLFKRALAHSTAEDEVELNVVSDGVEALEFLRHEGEFSGSKLPELIVLDINMPRMNGFETLEEIKKDAELSTIPVVILSSSVRREDVSRSYQSGACTFVSKPISFDDFCKMLKDFAKYWSQVATLPTASVQG